MALSKLARFVGWILMLNGVAGALAGFLIATGATQPETAIQYYFGTRTTGEVIDKGLMYAVVGMLIGVLGEIGVLSGRSK